MSERQVPPKRAFWAFGRALRIDRNGKRVYVLNFTRWHPETRRRVDPAYCQRPPHTRAYYQAMTARVAALLRSGDFKW